MFTFYFSYIQKIRISETKIDTLCYGIVIVKKKPVTETKQVSEEVTSEEVNTSDIE